MSKKVFTYDNFTGGERGIVSDWKKIPNSFRATNMLVYKTGEIGVRPGLVKINPSGLSNGKVWGFGSTGTPNADAFFIQGTHVYTFNKNGSNLQVAVTTITTPTKPCPYVEVGNSIYFTNYGDGTYRLDPNSGGAPTLTKLTSVSGVAIGAHGDRLLLGDISGSNHNRVRFSDALDYTSWPAVNFFDVADAVNITSILEQHNNIIIGKTNALYLISGTPGVSAVERKLITLNGPASPFAAITGYLDEIFFVGLGSTVPTQFNGAVATPQHPLDNSSFTGDVESTNYPIVGWTKLRARDEGVMNIGTFGTDKGMAYVNKVWTFHNFGVPVSGFMSQQGVDNIVLICDGGATSATPNFYYLFITKEFPGVNSTDSAGDDSSASLAGTLTMPIEQDSSGDEMQVQEVIVDFRVTNTGSSTHNHMDLQVLAYNRWSSLAQGSTVQSFDEASSSATGDRTRRFRIGCGEQGPGNGFQVLFTNIKGISIQKITVITDSVPPRGAL